MGEILHKASYIRLWFSLAQTYLSDNLFERPIDTADGRGKPDKIVKALATSRCLCSW